MMMVAAETLRRAGYAVTMVHPQLAELSSWFPSHHITKGCRFTPEDWIIAQNDNSETIRLLKRDYRSQLTIFYPHYDSTLCGEISSRDRIFNTEKTMAENIALSMASLLSRYPCKENGIVPPSHLVEKGYRTRVVIHHTAPDKKSQWFREKYDEVAAGLQKRGFDPVFVPEYLTLPELAELVYESGFVIGNNSLTSHLASNLHIPTLVIADKPEHMKLWRPGWYPGLVVTLADWIPNWGFLDNFFTRNWQYFISSEKVLKTFDKLAASC
jgi:hypothetical protein